MTEPGQHPSRGGATATVESTRAEGRWGCARPNIGWLWSGTRLHARIKRHGRTILIDAVAAAGGFGLADFLHFGPHVPAPGATLSALLLVAMCGLFNYAFGLHRRLWQYANASDMLALAGAVSASTLVFSVLDLLMTNRPYWLSSVPNGAALSVLLLLVVKLWPRIRETRPQPAGNSADVRALIVGAGDTGTMLVRDVANNPAALFRVVGFVDDDVRKTTMRLNGVPVLGTRHDIPRIVAEQRVDLIAIALPSSTRAEFDELMAICQQSGARVQVVPSPSEIATQQGSAVRLREIDIADLLGREEVRLDVAACAQYLQDKVVLVTGAAGSIGSELCRQLAYMRPRCLILLDTNETGLFDLQAALHGADAPCALEVCIADITDEACIARLFERVRPQVVFHAAAYKHVPLLETHPEAAVLTNVLGTAVLCRAAHAVRVERFVFISSDKAVAATNNLGYSKRIGELLMRAYAVGSPTIYCAVRFGNVVGSRGSVVPTFERQIAAGGPITVTHPEVTRFFMSIPEAACLVIEAAAKAATGSVYMLDMGQPVRIVALAEKILSLRGLRRDIDIAVVYTGLRPGEKMHEELTADMEDTAPTRHPKIMAVIDRRIVARSAMEANVRALVSLARRGDAGVAAALRRVSHGDNASAGADDDKDDAWIPTGAPADPALAV